MYSIKACSVLLAMIILIASALGQRSKSDEGISLYRAGDFAETVSRLTEATIIDKTDRQAWLYLAAAYKHLGKEKEAIKAFKASQSIRSQIPQNMTSW